MLPLACHCLLPLTAAFGLTLTHSIRYSPQPLCQFYPIADKWLKVHSYSWKEMIGLLVLLLYQWTGMPWVLSLWNHPIQVLISNLNTLFIPIPAFYLGLGFSSIFLAIEDTDCLETGELGFHVAHKPHCWEGGLEILLVHSSLDLVFIAQFSVISLPSLHL